MSTQLDPMGKPFPVLLNDCILKAANCEKTEYTPVWIMRQAGRYLPEFRELRKKHSFFEVCEQPKLACEVTLMPIRKFNLDAAIIFSDILVIPQALGQIVEMTSEGPKFPSPLDKNQTLESQLNFQVNIAQRLHYVYEAITLTRHELKGKCPLIGFSGAPWTLMCYMIEGGGSKTMSKAKRWLYEDPELATKLLDILASKVTDHLVEQTRAGAQMVQIFESNAEYMTRDLFEEFAYPQIIKICSQVKQRLKVVNLDNVPITVFAKGAHYAMDLLSKHKDIINVLSLDWTLDPVKMRNLTSQNLCLQGNLDPCALYSPPDKIRSMVLKMLNAFGTQNYIANLGHGIYPDMDERHVNVMVDAVHQMSRKMNLTS